MTISRQPTAIEQQHYQRLQAIFTAARQRYLEAGGDPRLSGGSFNQQDYLTDAEKVEIKALGRQVFALHPTDSTPNL